MTSPAHEPGAESAFADENEALHGAPTGGELVSTERDGEVTTEFVTPEDAGYCSYAVEDPEAVFVPPGVSLYSFSFDDEPKAVRTRPLIISGVYHGEIPVEDEE